MMSFVIFQFISNSVIKATDLLTVTQPYTGAKLKRKILLIIMILLFKSLVKGKGLYILYINYQLDALIIIYS